MSASRSSAFVWLLILATVSICDAKGQLYLVEGRSTGVSSAFEFTIDPVSNRLTVVIDNTQATSDGVTGTITSFGFNVPTSLIASTTLVSQTWNTLTLGRTEPADWKVVAPYNLNAGGGGYAQDAGVITGPNPNGGTPNSGIWFGEIVTFVFQFSDFSSTTDFLGENGVSARWQDVKGSKSGTSDVGFGTETSITPVPEPSTYALGGVLVVMAVAAFRKLKRRRAIG